MLRILAHLVIPTLAVASSTLQPQPKDSSGSMLSPISSTSERSKSYDSASSSILYSGSWQGDAGTTPLGHSVHSTSSTNASSSLTFIGSGIAWLGNLDKNHGIHDVFIDGERVETVDTSHPTRLAECTIFSQSDLAAGTHTIRIVNTGRKRANATGVVMDLGAFVVQRATDAPQAVLAATSTLWKIAQQSATGLNATQLVVVSPTHALVTGNPIHAGQDSSSVLYNIRTNAATVLDTPKHVGSPGTFLANGSFTLGGGSLDASRITQLTSASPSAYFHQQVAQELSGMEALLQDDLPVTLVRDQTGTTIFRVNTTASDADAAGHPTLALEHFPPPPSGTQAVHTVALTDSPSISNATPHAIALPDGTLFIVANQDALIHDPKTTTDRRLSTVPCTVSSAVLLPLSSEDNYTPEVLVCGDPASSDGREGELPLLAACFRMMLSEDGIALGWKREGLPAPGSVSDAMLLPTGHVLMLLSATANGTINTLVVYDPRSSYMAISSVSGVPLDGLASLTPGGDVMVVGAGAIAHIRPPYVAEERPEIVGGVPGVVVSERMVLQLLMPEGSRDAPNVQVVLMDLGVAARGAHPDQRMVYLTTTTTADAPADVEGDAGGAADSVWHVEAAERQRQRTRYVECSGVPHAGVYPPGPGWIYAVVDGVPSRAVRVMVGDVSEAEEAAMAPEPSVEQVDGTAKDASILEDAPVKAEGTSDSNAGVHGKLQTTSQYGAKVVKRHYHRRVRRWGDSV